MILFVAISACKSIWNYNSLVVYEYADVDGMSLGDYWIYDNIRYGQKDSLLFFCSYHDTTGALKRVLDAKVRIPKKLESALGDKTFLVSSSKMGKLDFVSMKERGEFSEYSIMKGVDSLERLEITNLISNDTLTFSIGENSYLFKSTRTKEIALDWIRRLGV